MARREFNLQMLGANVTGHEKTKNRPYDTLYTIFLPYTSDRGPISKGPSPNPRTKRLIDRIAAVCET